MRGARRALALRARRGVPVLALLTVSAATSRNILAFPGLRDGGYFPMRDRWHQNLPHERCNETVPGLEPLQMLDENKMCIFMAQLADTMRSPMFGVIINTFDAIEAARLS
uniref:Uncharacterized protein n=1 Tax=Leersia perrieri TaxID=77586 RepID=A0A0D9WXN1_9ORYZ